MVGAKPKSAHGHPASVLTVSWEIGKGMGVATRRMLALNVMAQEVVRLRLRWLRDAALPTATAELVCLTITKWSRESQLNPTYAI